MRPRLQLGVLGLPLLRDKAAAILDRVRDALDKAGPRSLLFLQNLTLLKWVIGSNSSQCVVEDGEGGLRILRSTLGAKPVQADRFIMLSRLVHRKDDARSYSVKIAMRLNDGGDIVPEAATTRLPAGKGGEEGLLLESLYDCRQ